MRFIFWQNTNSIHQSDFFNALARTGVEVFLIVTMPISKKRVEMGWNEPSLEKVNVIYAYKNSFNIYNFLKENKSDYCFHIFSGIAAFPLVHQAFIHAVKLDCRMGVFTEPLDFRGFKGKLRWLRGYLHKFRWGKNIEFILPTGTYGVKQFITWGYSSDKIFEWAYTVEKTSYDIYDDKADENVFKIMFAGSLIQRKGYDLLIEALQALRDAYNFKADFYCLSNTDLEQGKQLVSGSTLKSKLELHQFLPNYALRQKMNEYDLFVLPSRHDGWGAVVTESLMEGTPVVVTEACGSSSQVRHNSALGRVVEAGNVKELEEGLKTMMTKGKHTGSDREKNRSWAESHISGDQMARYFNEIIRYVNNDSQNKATVPWLS